MTTDSSLHLAEPQQVGPLAVFPIVGEDARIRFRSLAQGCGAGAFVTEVDERGSINDVLVCNTTDDHLLMYEGELILGARQNRTIDQPVLVPAGVELRVPVSCVEQGRWDGKRRAQRFAPAPFTVDPGLRASKRADANRNAVAGGEGRPSQGAVWLEVDERLATHAVASRSMALTDIYTVKRSDLKELQSEITAVPGQLGAVVEFAGRPVALDLVGCQDVFADLLPGLADGYALLGLEREYAARLKRATPSAAAAADFLHAALAATRGWMPTPGMGDGFTLSGKAIQGAGLTAERELIALSAFPPA